jgi:hypothetical protein
VSKGTNLMSAAKDSSQPSFFIYSNFPHLALKGKSIAQPELTKGMVLKSARAEALPAPAEVRVVSQAETEAFAGWTSGEAGSARSGVAQQLLTLRQARKRLSFMMQEIDEILKRA